MRAVTRTTLTLGDLLEIPIGLAPATSAKEIKFDTAAPDGASRQQLYVHPDKSRTLFERDDESGEMSEVEVPVPVTDTIKGVRVGTAIRQVPESELAWAKAATKLSSVELLEFLDYRKVPTDRLSGSHWVQPDPGFEKPLATLMAAMRKDGRAMLVKYNVRDRQRLGVIRVRRTHDGDALLLNEVAYAEAWREPDAQVLAASKVEVDERAVEAARSIIEDLAGDGEALKDARDELLPKLTEIVEHASEGDYEDPQRVLQLAAELREDDALIERADQLVAYAEARWPELEAKREEVEAVLAEGGEGVGEKLAAIVG